MNDKRGYARPSAYGHFDQKAYDETMLQFTRSRFDQRTGAYIPSGYNEAAGTYELPEEANDLSEEPNNSAKYVDMYKAGSVYTVNNENSASVANGASNVHRSDTFYKGTPHLGTGYKQSPNIATFPVKNS